MLPPPLPFHGVPTLGWHPVGHCIKPSEYAFYHDQLWYFFKQPYSHAAFGMGGIVWCLAHTMVSDDLTDSLVINRPSMWATVILPNASQMGPFFATTALLSKSWISYVEFIKLRQVMHFFLAVHYLVKLTCLIIIGCADQTADVSWWPKHNMFMRSGLWQGYWLPTCEVWFQDWLSCIEDQSATIWATNQWTTNISQHARKTWDFLKLNANITHKFLPSLDGQWLA